jgi:hypothetical protein
VRSRLCLAMDRNRTTPPRRVSIAAWLTEEGPYYKPSIGGCRDSISAETHLFR